MNSTSRCLASCSTLLLALTFALPEAIAQIAPTNVRQAASRPAQPTRARGWSPRGIGGGGALFSVSISPHNPREIYMVTDMSTVFHTRDMGARWKTLPFFELRGGMDTHVRFTGDANTLYATTSGNWDERQLVKSQDAGRTFSLLSADPTQGEVFLVQADPHAANRLLVAGWNELFFSGNGGQSFASVHSAAGNPNGLLVGGSLWLGQDIFVGTNEGLLVSHDGGLSFAVDSTAGIPTGRVITAFAGAQSANGIRLFAVTAPTSDVWGGIVPQDLAHNDTRTYRLNWGSGNWTQVHSGAGGQTPIFLGMSEGDSQVVWAAGMDHNLGHPMVLRSNDGGATWQSVLRTQGNQNVGTGWMGASGDLNWGWAENAMGFAVAPGDSDRAVITDWGFVHATEDGGQTWHQSYVAPGDENPSGQNTPNGAAYRTSGVDQTTCWDLLWPTPQIVIAGFSDFAGIRSTDQGQHWSAASSQGLTDNSTYRLLQHPTGMLLAATSTTHDLYQSTYLRDSSIDGGDGRLMSSTNGGAQWQTLHDFGHPVVWIELDPADPDTLYASVVHSTQGGIYVTHNLTGAATFTRLPAPPRTEGHPYNIQVLNDGTLVSTWSGRRTAGGAFTTSSGVFYSTDGGQSWLDRSHSDMQRWTKDITIDPHDPTQNTWYAAVFSHWGAWPNEVGGVYRTTDRGLQWTRISDLYRVESVALDPLVPGRAWACTEVRGLWRTDNVGAANPTFQRDDSYPFQHPIRLRFNPHNPDEIWSTSFGGGLRMLQR